MDENLIRLLISIGSALVGVWVGYRFNLGLARRKEYNSAIEPIRLSLVKNYPIEHDLITALESKLGKRANKIVDVYEKYYKPSQLLPVCSSGYDDDGNVVAPLDPNIIKKNRKIQKNSRNIMIKVCKLK